MTCESIPGGGIACNFTEKWTYICFEHTTYIMEFSPNFGPYWFRLEGKKEIDVYPEPDGHLDILWDIFDEWHYGQQQIKST